MDWAAVPNRWESPLGSSGHSGGTGWEPDQCEQISRRVALARTVSRRRGRTSRVTRAPAETSTRVRPGVQWPPKRASQDKGSDKNGAQNSGQVHSSGTRARERATGPCGWQSGRNRSRALGSDPRESVGHDSKKLPVQRFAYLRRKRNHD